MLYIYICVYSCLVVALIAHIFQQKPKGAPGAALPSRATLAAIRRWATPELGTSALGSGSHGLAGGMNFHSMTWEELEQDEFPWVDGIHDD